MSWDKITSAIETYLQTNWSTTAIASENIAYAPGTASWIRLTIALASSARETLTGNPATGHLSRGIALINIFTKANTGAGAAGRYADTLIALFREKLLAVSDGTEVVFLDEVDQTGDEGSEWYQVNLSFPFEHHIL